MSLEDQLIQYIPDLRRFARSLERNRVAADDLVQATLERAIRKLHLYQPTGPFLGWLNTIMRNIFVDGVRRRSNGLTSSIDEESWNEPFQNENQVDRIVLKDVHRAVEMLPVEQRRVLMMVAVQGMTYEATAAELGVPLGTIRSRLFRARLYLQRRMDPEGELTRLRGKDHVEGEP